MPKPYVHLSFSDREKIAVLRQHGLGVRKIAEQLKRDPGTISRELWRNSGQTYKGCYLPHLAQERADERKADGHQRVRLSAPGLKTYTRRMLARGWSPERIAGRWRELGRKAASHEAIYQWIYKEAKELIHFLPRAHRKRFRHSRVRGARVIPIPSRIPISRRPRAVETRKQAGHWEADLILGPRQHSAIQVLVERKSRYARLVRLKGRTADEVRRAINRSLAQYPKHLRRTITFDNGRENRQHLRINRTLGTKSYFCEPMHSWEKGSVENVAGLVRRRLPKRTDLAKVSSQSIQRAQRWLNGLPRKCLGFKTAAEAFRASVALTG